VSNTAPPHCPHTTRTCCNRCPPGHGDIYPALLGTGMLARLREKGINYVFVSNSDNLGATLDLDLLAYFAQSGNGFLMEVGSRATSNTISLAPLNTAICLATAPTGGRLKHLRQGRFVSLCLDRPSRVLSGAQQTIVATKERQHDCAHMLETVGRLQAGCRVVCRWPSGRWRTKRVGT
jgi:UTP--glucose-1-phosphate uridylyltransferase